MGRPRWLDLLAVDVVLVGGFLAWVLLLLGPALEESLLVVGIPWTVAALYLLLAAPRTRLVVPVMLCFAVLPNLLSRLLARLEAGWVGLLLAEFLLPASIVLGSLHVAYGSRKKPEAMAP